MGERREEYWEGGLRRGLAVLWAKVKESHWRMQVEQEERSAWGFARRDGVLAGGWHFGSGWDMPGDLSGSPG